MLRKFVLYIVLVLLVAVGVPCFAHDKNTIVRVGISDAGFQKYVFDSTEITSTEGFDLINIPTGEMLNDFSSGQTAKIILKNGFYNIVKEEKQLVGGWEGPIVVKPKKSSLIGIANLKRGGRQAYYRGIFEIVKNSSNKNVFSVVNVLDLESYLMGVVPNEMPVSFGLEALKAQTIAARNYALRPREKFYKEFDLSDSVASQVYFGANTEKSLSNAAIKETNGLVALSPSKDLILALYSSTAGGYTENYEFALSDPKTKAFPSSPVAYLKARPDFSSYKKLDNEQNAKEYFMSKPDSFDSQSPYYRWNKSWDCDVLSAVLAKTLVEQSKIGFVSPKVESLQEFGHLIDLRVVKRGESGKVVTLAVVTDKNTFYVSKELVIRRTFLKDGKALPSANFIIDKVLSANGPIFTFYGAGFGHGVGMSQFGAGGMASRGYSYDKILQHYYKGISIGTNPLYLSTNKDKNSAEQVFFTNTHEAWLCVETKGDLDSIKAIFNGKMVDFEMKIPFQNRYRFDISSYIQQGQNTVVYWIPNNDGWQKTARIYIEVKEAINE